MIYCVEDDDSIREIEVYTLKSTGFEAQGFRDGASFRAALMSGEQPTLVILDIMLPGENGVDLLQFLRSREETAAVPVLMATAKGMEYDKVRALDLGADDYLVKPFGMMEMVSRVRAVLRRCGANGDTDILRAGEIEMITNEHTVKINGQTVILTYKEFELLRLFMSAPGIVFTREQLMSDIWGMDYMGETRTVDTHILTLRRKLGPAGDRIQTVRGVGYRMEGAK